MTQDELRAEFERWAKSKKLPITISEHFINAGAYSHQDTHVAWLSYQACNAKWLEEAKAPHTISAKTIDVMQFIYDRLINVHKENPNYDYMHAFRRELATLGITVREL